ncbi:hypothetical protein DA792_13555 [Celeribacter baekdonensis]|uniref:HNH nuclease domain-containing protein n=1 Tax=Celeribacter baekdonensis TaxID=875171 RepID=A0A2R4M483_9RHOB|nr:hypothetical protein DA792_13555 [Celeribacter baekdonensis]
MIAASYDDVVRHRCNNRRCINPAHLEIGTRGENFMDEREFAANGWTMTYSGGLFPWPLRDHFSTTRHNWGRNWRQSTRALRSAAIVLWSWINWLGW